MKRFLKKIVVSIITLQARLVIKKFSPKIIGITGSVGKTSTKDMVYEVLSKEYFVRKSQKSFNSEIGVPLTVLGLGNQWSDIIGWFGNILKGFFVLFQKTYPEWLVLEIGLDTPGDIEQVVSWIQFDVVIFTKLSKIPVHLEFFESADALRKEKRMLAGGLKKGGILIVNKDDEYQQELLQKQDARVYTYSLEDNEADFYASDTAIAYTGGLPIGMKSILHHKDDAIEIIIQNTLGKYHIAPPLIGFSLSVALEMREGSLEDAILSKKATPGRMHILKGIHDSIIIDDSYNASPDAVHEALNTLSIVQAQRKIVVLGDMLELGKESIEQHKKIGKQVAGVADVLITVGIRGKEIGKEASSHVEEYIDTTDAVEAGVVLRSRLRRGDIVLIKGSQSMRMERAVASVVDPCIDKEQELVRHDRMWLSRK